MNFNVDIIDNLKPRISIIIPVYNTSSYLEKCLDSVLGQTLSDIEVICIDDCSTDDSFTILDKYSKKDKRIKCFKNDLNIGLGLTRNKGIDLACGEYIAFVDSDDWIEADMYEILYAKTKVKKYDLVCCNLKCNFPDGSLGVPVMPSTEQITLEFLINAAVGSSIRFFSPNSACDKIYRSEKIEELNLRFESEREILYEDKLFNLNFYVSKPSFYFELKGLYNYMIRYNSTMTSYKKNFVERYFIMDVRTKKILSENNLMSKELQQRFKKDLFEMTFSFCSNTLVNDRSIKFKLLDFLKLINDNRISSNAKYFKISDIPESSSKITGLVKIFCFMILKYLR